MKTYRAYLLNDKGHFKDVVALPAETDEQALEAVQIIPAEHGLELWQGPRFIATLKASEHRSADVQARIDEMFPSGRA